MSLNKVMLIGNCGKTPEIKNLDSGKIATFTLATSERYKRRDGEQIENTEWHNIVCWGKSADVVEAFVEKGTPLFIDGKIRTRSYESQSGEKKFITEILVNSLQLLGKKSKDEDSGKTPPSEGGFRQPAGPGPGDDAEGVDDLPF